MQVIIRKDNIILDRHFPFRIDNVRMPPGHNMGGVFHWHECLEVSYVKSGTGRYYIEDKVYEMSPGDVIILNNIEPHYLEVYESGMHQPVIVFDPSLVWSNCSNSMDYEYLMPFFERGSDFNNKLDMNEPFASEIKENLLLLEKEFFEKPEGYMLMIKARLLMILTYLIRCFRDSSKAIPQNINKRQNLMRIEEALKFISENYREDIKLEDVASKIYVTPQYFSSLFKKTTGKTFIDYVTGLRINTSIKLLKDTDRKITDIAIDCGFNNMANFNSVFKKYIGKTPSDFRRAD